MKKKATKQADEPKPEMVTVSVEVRKEIVDGLDAFARAAMVSRDDVIKFALWRMGC